MLQMFQFREIPKLANTFRSFKNIGGEIRINCVNVLWLKIFIRYKLSKTADWQSKSCNKYF